MTTKVQAHCIKIAVRAGRIELATKLAVMSNLEANRHGGFFVHNAEYDAREAGMTKHQFAGGLSAMQKKGQYVASQDPEYRGTYGQFKDVQA